MRARKKKTVSDLLVTVFAICVYVCVVAFIGACAPKHSDDWPIVAPPDNPYWPAATATNHIVHTNSSVCTNNL